jgi:hypothetical protein
MARDPEDLAALAAEHGAVWAKLLLGPDRAGVDVAVRAFADDRGAIRLVIEDTEDIKQQLVIDEERLRWLLDQPQDLD